MILHVLSICISYILHADIKMFLVYTATEYLIIILEKYSNNERNIFFFCANYLKAV